MRACGQCGKPGHNKRTCTDQQAPITATSPAIRPLTDSLDAETLEAIEWYLNSRDPKRADWIAAGRPNTTGFKALDEDQE
jgi:hypothetical protein